MHEHASTVLQPEGLTPSTLQQVYRQIVSKAQASVQAGRPLVAIRGQLGAMQERGSSTIYYAVPLYDDEGTVFLDIPKELVRRAGMGEGDIVMAVGIITAKCDRFTNYHLRFQVDVSDLVVLDAPTNSLRHVDEQATRALLKEKTARTPFPQKPRLSLRVLHSAFGQVLGDFQHAMAPVMDSIDAAYIPVAMTNAGAIATAIEAAVADILVIIRGGGPEEQFRVFDDQRVVRALARKQGVYRVVGLGHTEMMTLLDMVSDFAAPTPSLAGSHIREQIEWFRMPLQQLQSEQARTKTLQAQLAAREKAGLRPPPSMPGWAVLLIGAVLGVLVGLWMR